MKKLFLILAIALFVTAAIAQSPDFVNKSAVQTITVNATIQQSASLTLTGNVVNFNVTDPTVATSGGSITANGTVNIAKGHYYQFVLDKTPLVGKNGGGTIDDLALLVKAGGNGFQPLTLGGSYYGLTTASVGVNGLAVSFPMEFQLAPISNVPDQYTGTVTVTLWVV